MDRRQKKTRDAIFKAFSKLLESQRYEHITVQEIIDEANIGRSTFYAHFETKDELLRALCNDIFHHVFTEELPQEADQEHNSTDKRLELKLGHILYHLQEHRTDLIGILPGRSGDLFMGYFREYLRDLFQRYPQESQGNVPADYLMHHLVSSFSETVKWWITETDRYTPEEVAGFYMAVIRQKGY